jgi:hypothetical protein
MVSCSQEPWAEISQRKVALIAGLALLLNLPLAAFAQFIVLRNLVVPADATETFSNIMAAEVLFRSGIAAFLIVIMFDIVAAWALYVLLRPVNRTLALLTAWLRLAFAAVFASALVNLLDAAQLVGGAEQSALQEEQLHAQMMSSIASFDNGWVGIALPILGLHLVGLGYLLFRSADFPWYLGVLVVISGGGYLADSFTRIFIPDFAITFSLFPDIAFTFGSFTAVGKGLLFLWLLGRAYRGFPSNR